jgi:DNA-binding cell septation regulator SpoVG
MAMEISDIKITVSHARENRVRAYVAFVVDQCLLIRPTEKRET